MPAPILDQIQHWPEAAQLRLQAMRALFYDVADTAKIGPLDESLKWGQPAWRPRRARMGSTVRLNWSEAAPRSLMAYVDCKTDLATQLHSRFPHFPNDGRRALRFDLGHADTDAAWQLAFLTFTYHRSKRVSAR